MSLSPSAVEAPQTVTFSFFAYSETAFTSSSETFAKSIPSRITPATAIPPALRALSVLTTFEREKLSREKLRIVRFETIDSLSSAAFPTFFFFASSVKIPSYHEITFEE